VSNYPSIPTPQPDVQSLLITVTALKQVVDLLTGVVGNAGPSMRIYIQAEAPTNPTSGDAWLRVSDRNLLIWSAVSSTWVATL
jgi:hypothetical protein